MKISWWKMACIALLVYTIIAGFLMEVPTLPILNESIRNLYFHVPMWFGMIYLLLISFINSIRYLQKPKPEFDTKAVEYANSGIIFGILGLVTGMLWAKYTWGAYWSGDPKQNASAIGLLIYFAYMVLRGSFNDDQQKARISAVYNIFAFCILIPLLFVLPRLTDSLHPGNGGNPGFNSYDLDNRMRLVFYPANIAWIMLGVWITQLRYRMRFVEQKLKENQSK
ncbi:MAG: cytochrome c biogenesis protein CcsA [Bacteroidota bacterium]|nr:cytochrome c biogenesis protein CcsA [Bacteroidota bacterium]